MKPSVDQIWSLRAINILCASSPPNLALSSPGLGLGFGFEEEKKLVGVGEFDFVGKISIIVPP